MRYIYFIEYGRAIITGYEPPICDPLVIPSTIGGYPVTLIGRCAFKDCASLTSVTIPDSVTYIDDRAFEGCTNLTSVTIGRGVNELGADVFRYCTKLTSITIPGNVMWLGPGLFLSCTSLTNVSIPDSVTSIGSGVFQGCSSLTSITIPDSVTNISRYAFEECTGLTNITLPDKLTSIGLSAFCGCSSLASITIPDSVINMEGNPFCGCTSLTSIAVSSGNPHYMSVDDVLFDKENAKLITYSNGKARNRYEIPLGVTGIVSEAFAECTSLTSVTIPNSVIGIGRCAFRGCTSLIDITIPESVINIKDNPFCGCTSLTSITVSSSNERYMSIDGVLFDKKNSELVVYPSGKTAASYIIPFGVTSIGNYAFSFDTRFDAKIGEEPAGSGNPNLTGITIPDCVDWIGLEAFADCANLIDLYYAGPQFCWEQIHIDYDNDYLCDLVIHFDSDYPEQMEECFP